QPLNDGRERERTRGGATRPSELLHQGHEENGKREVEPEGDRERDPHRPHDDPRRESVTAQEGEGRHRDMIIPSRLRHGSGHVPASHAKIADGRPTAASPTGERSRARSSASTSTARSRSAIRRVSSRSPWSGSPSASGT